MTFVERVKVWVETADEGVMMVIVASYAGTETIVAVSHGSLMSRRMLADVVRPSTLAVRVSE